MGTEQEQHPSTPANLRLAVADQGLVGAVGNSKKVRGLVVFAGQLAVLAAGGGAVQRERLERVDCHENIADIGLTHARTAIQGVQGAGVKWDGVRFRVGVGAGMRGDGQLPGESKGGAGGKGRKAESRNWGAARRRAVAAARSGIYAPVLVVHSWDLSCSVHISANATVGALRAPQAAARAGRLTRASLNLKEAPCRRALCVWCCGGCRRPPSCTLQW